MSSADGYVQYVQQALTSQVPRIRARGSEARAQQCVAIHVSLKRRVSQFVGNRVALLLRVQGFPLR